MLLLFGTGFYLLVIVYVCTLYRVVYEDLSRFVCSLNCSHTLLIKNLSIYDVEGQRVFEL